MVLLKQCGWMGGRHALVGCTVSALSYMGKFMAIVVQMTFSHCIFVTNQPHHRASNREDRNGASFSTE